MLSELEKIFEKNEEDDITRNYSRLVNFIDVAISQAFNCEHEERANNLLRNFLNMRTFLTTELSISREKVSRKDQVEKAFRAFLSDHDLDLKELQEIKIKKKEKESEGEQQHQENISVTDQLTLSSEEES